MSTNKKIRLYDIKLSSEVRKEVDNTLRSGWLSTGPKTAAFEKAIAKLMKTKYSVAVASASDGLKLAFETLGVAPGFKIVTSPFSFLAAVEACVTLGGTPVFADIDPDTLNLDPDDVDKKISDKTKAVVPVDVAGCPADYGRLNEICNKHKVPLIGDAAHGIGSRYKNKPVCAQADVSVLSFHATKNLICGEGGMVLSNHKVIIDTIRLMSRHGITANAGERKKQKNKWEYDATTCGHKANMSELHASVGLGHLKSFDKEQAKRKKLAERYLANLNDLSDLISLPFEPKNTTHGWHLFITRLNLSRLKISRDKFIHLMSQKGIECGVHFIPIFNFTFYNKFLKLNPADYPNTVDAFSRVVSLPLYPSLSLKDVDYICQTINDLLKAQKK